MDELIAAALDQIGLCGLQGATIESIKHAAAEAYPSPIDEYILEWLWKQLNKRPDLSFVVQNTASIQYKVINNGAIRGFADLNRSDLDNPTGKRIADIMKEHGNRFRIVGSPSLREKSIGAIGSSVTLSEIQYAMLDYVGQCGAKGCLQSDLPKIFGLDAKQSFFHIRKLEISNFVNRSAVISQKGSTVRTQTIRLPRFLGSVAGSTLEKEKEKDKDKEDDDDDDEDDAEPERNVSVLELERSVCRLLDAAKDKIMRDIDVQHWIRARIGRTKHVWVNIRETLVRKNCLDVFVARVAGDESERAFQCVKLLKMPDFEEEAAISPLKAAQSMQIVAELPIEQQIYRMIVAAAATPLGGIYQKDLKVMGIKPKLMRSRMDVIMKERGVSAIPYSIGKYSTFLMTARISDEEKTNVMKAIQLTNEAALKAQQERNALAALQAPASADPNNTSISAADNDAMQVDLESEQPRAPADASSMISPKTKYKKAHKVTLQSVQREERIYDMIKSERIMLVLRIRKLFEADDKEGGIDGKTIGRILSRLQDDGKIDLVNVIVPQLKGSRSFPVAKLRELDIASEEFQSFKNQLQDAEFVARMLPAPAQKPELPTVILQSAPLNTEGAPSWPGHNQAQGEKSAIRIAINYGYIKPVMLRVKLFHRHLWKFANPNAHVVDDIAVADATASRDRQIDSLLGPSIRATNQTSVKLEEVPSTLDPNYFVSVVTPGVYQSVKVVGDKIFPPRGLELSGTVPLQEIITSMTVEQYVQIIGCTTVIEDLETYRDNGTLVSNLPSAIRDRMLNRRAYVRRLAHLISILQSLKLVVRPAMLDASRQENVVVSTQPTEQRVLQISKYAQIFDAEEMIVKTFDFSDAAQQSKYWTDLETACHFILRHQMKPPEAQNEEDLEGKEVSEAPKALGDIWSDFPNPALMTSLSQAYPIPDEACRLHAWRGSQRLSKVQKAIIVDRMAAVMEETPDFSHISPEVVRVAAATSLTGVQVLVVYRAILAAQRAREVKKSRLAEKDRDSDSEDSDEESSRADKRKKRKKAQTDAVEQVTQRPKKRRRRSEGKQLPEDSAAADASTNPAQLAPLVDPSAKRQRGLRPLSVSVQEVARRQRQKFQASQQSVGVETAQTQEPAAETTPQEPMEDDPEPTGRRQRIRVPWKPQEDLLLLRLLARFKADLIGLPDHPTFEEITNVDNPSALLDTLSVGVDWNEISRELADPKKTNVWCRKRARLLLKKVNNIRVLQAAIAQRVRSPEYLAARGAGTFKRIPADIAKLREVYEVHHSSALIWQSDSPAYSPLADAIKTILMLPEGRYVVDAAKDILMKFSPENVDRCFSLLRDLGFITKTKAGHGASTRPSIRGYHINFKFDLMFKHPYSETFSADFLSASRFLFPTRNASLLDDTNSMDVDEDSASMPPAVAIEQDTAAHKIEITTLPSPGSVAASLTAVSMDSVVMQPVISDISRQAPILPREKSRVKGRVYRRAQAPAEEGDVQEADENDDVKLDPFPTGLGGASRWRAPEKPMKFSESSLPHVKISIWHALEDSSAGSFEPSPETLGLSFADVFPEERRITRTIADFKRERPAFSLFDAYGTMLSFKTEEESRSAMASYLAYCEEVYNSICKAGSDGISLVSLQKAFEQHVDICEALQTITNDLTAFGLTFRISHNTGPAYVASSLTDANKWVVFPFTTSREAALENSNVSVERVAYEADKPPTVFAPWLLLDGTIDQNGFRQQFLLPLVAYLIQNPGVYESTTIEHFNLFRPAVTMELIDMLINFGAIRTSHLCIRARRSFAELFSRSASPETVPCAESEFLLHRADRLGPNKYERCLFPSVDVLQKILMN